MNNAVNAISHDSDQSPFRGGLSQRANSLADALNRAEFVECVPALRKPWAVAQRHPMVRAYMAARLAVELSLPPRPALVIDPFVNDRVEHKRATGGLRRAVDLWARIEKRQRDAIKLKRNEASDFAKKKQVSVPAR